MPRHADQHVLNDRHVAEHLQGLEGTDDALPRGGMHGADLRFRSIKDNTAGVRTISARYDIDERRLARAVWPDQRMNRSALYAKGHIGQGEQPAERTRNIFDLQLCPGSGGQNRRHIVGAHDPLRPRLL
jgi:hypothetical protein